MDHCAPTLAEVASTCVSAGIGHLSVLPLFISSGGHVNREIREQTAAVGATYPELTVVTLPALGELDGVRAALSALIARQIGDR
jgi:sirohydrochlorin cobaltochelatase